VKRKKRNFDEENDKIFQKVSGVFTIIAVVLFLYNVEPWRGRGCYLNENSIFQKEFKGRVIDKFIDYPQHATESVRFSPKSKVALLRGDYYNEIEIGDSIHKIENSFKLEIHKRDTSFEMTYKLPCEEKGFLYHN
jgi:hypothetical protein